MLSEQEIAANEPAELQGSLVESVAQQIMSYLAKGLFVPGQRLVARDLALEFNVSRAPVREALHILAGEGVVDLIPNRGAVIRKLAVKDLMDVMELTEAICVVGLRRATQQIDQGDNRERVTEAFAEVVRIGETRHSGPFVEALYNFHLLLNEIGDNGYVSAFYRRAHFPFFNRALSERLPGPNWEIYMSNYARIYDTIMAGNVHAATATFVAHMQWAIEILHKSEAEARRPRAAIRVAT